MSSRTLGGYFQIGQRRPGSRSRDARSIGLVVAVLVAVAGPGAIGGALGVVVGGALGVAVGVALGVAVRGALGVAVGVALGVAVGVALGVAAEK